MISKIRIMIKSGILYMFLFMMLSCAAQKITEDITVVYDASTRGRSKNVMITKKGVVSRSHHDKNEDNIEITDKQNEQLYEIIKKIDLENIANLKAPSEKRLFDGAMATDIFIRIGDKQYKSSSFDHDNPPAELKELTDFIEKLSKK